MGDMKVSTLVDYEFRIKVYNFMNGDTRIHPEVFRGRRIERVEKRVIQFASAIINGEYNDELMDQALVPNIRGTCQRFPDLWCLQVKALNLAGGNPLVSRKVTW